MSVTDTEIGESAVLAAELRMTLGALVRRLRDQAEARDLTAAQKSVLLRLERDGPATTSALARAEAMRPQSMGAIVAALQTAGHVAGSPDPTDGRQTIVALTDRCRAWIQEVRAVRQDWLHHALDAQLSGDERERLADAVGLLNRLVTFQP